MLRFAALLLILATASCGTPVPREAAPTTARMRSRITVVDVENSGTGMQWLADATKEHLQDLLYRLPRFEVLDRSETMIQILENRMPDPVRIANLAGADWVVYGRIIDESSASGPHVLHLRVVRVETGTLAYSGNCQVADAENRFSSTGLKEMVLEIDRLIP